MSVVVVATISTVCYSDGGNLGRFTNKESSQDCAEFGREVEVLNGLVDISIAALSHM